MHLSRRTITRASQIMLPADVIFAAALGITWLAQPHLGPGAALNNINAVWSVKDTAILLLGLAILEVGALLTRLRNVEAFALLIGALVFSAIGVLLVAGHQPGSSYSAPYWPFYVALAHVASAVSLIFEEGDRTVEQGTH